MSRTAGAEFSSSSIMHEPMTCGSSTMLPSDLVEGSRTRSLSRRWRMAGLGTLLAVAHPSDVEARLAALEARIEEVAADAAAARHLAAARDRDLADLGVKVDANRAAISALGVQTAARFNELENEMRQGFAETAMGFVEMRGKLDQAAAGQQQIVELLTDLSSGQGDQ